MSWTSRWPTWSARAAAFFFLGLGAAAAERWEMQYFHDENDSTLSFSDLQFPTAQQGLAVGMLIEQRSRKPVAAVTANGGRSWELLTLKEAPVSLFFLNEQAGWMVTERGRLWRTSDAGRNWTRAELSGVRATPLRVFFLDESRGWLLCGQKQVYSTSDGGRSWQVLEVSRSPDVPEARSLYNWADFFGQVGLLTGWSRAPERRPTFPAWMEPDAMPLGRRPTTSVILLSTDGGRNWDPQLLPRFGEIVRARLVTAGAALLLVQRPDSLTVPTEIMTFDLQARRGDTLYADKDRWITDMAFAGPNRVFAAAIDQEGRTPFPAIPAKLKVLQSTDARQWTEMDVDYRAEARHAVLAAPDSSHAWIATDTGMILRWVKE